MFAKIKAFFEKKAVKIVEGALIAVASAGLVIGGVSATEIVPKITTSTVGVLLAIEALVTIIQGITFKQ